MKQQLGTTIEFVLNVLLSGMLATQTAHHNILCDVIPHAQCMM